MKVVAFNGSPRKNGNTSMLIDAVFKELNQNMIETEKINIGIKPVSGCMGCRKCIENKNMRCVIETDMFNDCVAKIDAADGIILGSPVYVADVSGQMKNFIDRLCLLGIANNRLLYRKVGASVIAVRRAGALQAYHTINSLFGMSQMISVGSRYWNLGIGRDPGDVKHDDEGIQTMMDLGRNMAWILENIHL